MTLKTSLIITGDSATAQKAVEDLNRDIEKLSGTSRGAIVPATQLAGATDRVEQSSRRTSGAIVAVGTAQTGAIATGRALAVTQGALAIATDVAAVSMGGFGIAAGTVQAILTGGVSVAITAVTTLLGALALNLFETEEAADEASAGLDAFAKRQSDIANFIDFTTGKLKEQNQTLIQNAILTREKTRDRQRAEAQDVGRGVIGDVRAAVRTGSRFVAERQARAPAYDVKLLNAVGAATSGRGVNIEELDRQLGGLGNGYAALRSQVSSAAGQVILAEREANRLDNEIRALKGDASALMRDPKEVTTKPRSGSGGRRSVPNSGAVDRDAAKATNEAAAAQRQLAQDLQGVIARYDPARKAAEDYAEELERIARLGVAYDPAKGVGLSPDDVKKYTDAAAAANKVRMAELARTPESKAADEARKSIDGMIGSLKGEIAARQELDPIQRQMLQYRDELAKLPAEEAAAREAELRGWI